jgi:hypothetical protein
MNRNKTNILDKGKVKDVTQPKDILPEAESSGSIGRYFVDKDGNMFKQNESIYSEAIDKTSYFGHKNIISTLPPEDNPIKSPVLTSPSLDDLNSKVEDS